MLNSNVLEVAGGVVFMFLAVSLATGAIVEALASITTWRSRTLITGVQQLLNDTTFTGLARDLYQHALINPRGPGASAPTKNMPAYIDPAQFARALTDLLGMSAVAGGAGAPAPGRPMAVALQTAVNAAVPPGVNAQLNAMLTGIVQRSGGEIDKVQKEIATWFDNAMDRVSGTYKRHTQVVGLVVALALSVVCNIDTIHIARTLWQHPGQAQLADAAKNMPNVDVALRTLENSFPVGWPQGKWFSAVKSDGTPQDFATDDWAQAVVGWLISALATLFGAPFWFDALQSIVRLKGSGPSPAEKKSDNAAAD